MKTQSDIPPYLHNITQPLRQAISGVVALCQKHEKEKGGMIALGCKALDALEQGEVKTAERHLRVLTGKPEITMTTTEGQPQSPFITTEKVMDAFGNTNASPVGDEVGIPVTRGKEVPPITLSEFAQRLASQKDATVVEATGRKTVVQVGGLELTLRKNREGQDFIQHFHMVETPEEVEA